LSNLHNLDKLSLSNFNIQLIQIINNLKIGKQIELQIFY